MARRHVKTQGVLGRPTSSRTAIVVQRTVAAPLRLTLHVAVALVPPPLGDTLADQATD